MSNNFINWLIIVSALFINNNPADFWQYLKPKISMKMKQHANNVYSKT